MLTHAVKPPPVSRWIVAIAAGSLVLAACAPSAPAAPTSAPAPTAAPAAKPTEAPKPAVPAASPAAKPAASPAASPAAAPAASPAAKPTTAPAAKPTGPADQVTFITDFALFGYVAPIYAGMEQGFFRDENIELAITPGQGSADTATKVGAGAAQFGLADTITTVVANGRGAPIRLVAAHWQRHVGGMAYVQGRKEIRTWKDIEGLKIGAVQGDAYLVILPELMRQNGANPEAYEVVAMGAAQTTAAVLAGQVDASPVGAPTFPSRALGVRSQGAELKLFAFADNGLDAIGHGVIVNQDVLSRNADLVRRFVRAYARSMVWSQQPENQDKAIDAYMKSNPQQSREGEKANYLNTLAFQVDPRAQGFAGQFVFPPAKLEATVALANKAYSLTVRPEAVYTNEFATALPQAWKDGKLQ